MNEIEGTRPNSCSQAFARWNQEVKSSRRGFKYFSSGWILMVPKHSLLKYFTLTFTRHKSSKFEGSGPPLKPCNYWAIFMGSNDAPHKMQFWLFLLITLSTTAVRGASIVRCGFSCLVDLNSDLYRLYSSLHGLDTFWTRGLSRIKKETTTTTTWVELIKRQQQQQQQPGSQF